MPDEIPDRPQEKRKLPLKSILVLAAIMLLEGGVFALWLTFAEPTAASGAVKSPLASDPVAHTAEVTVLNFRAPNTQTGKLWLYDMEIVIEVPRDRKLFVDKIVQDRQAAIRDALNTLIRRAEPQHLVEPELQTLRRQIQVTLTDILGEDNVENVLIPQCTPYRADY